MTQFIWHKIRNNLFYGNLFVGFCVVFLCIETNIQHGLLLNGVHFYTIAFVATVYFYSFLYLHNIPNNYSNHRVEWYKKYRKPLQLRQQLLLIFLTAAIALFVYQHSSSFSKLNALQFGQILIFPFVAFVYAFNILPFPNLVKLRRVGWLKPFVIGFVWSGFVTVFPIIFYQIQTDKIGSFFSWPSGILWLKNWMFISTLCIMFDLKDIEQDNNEGIKTFGVAFGKIKTINFIIIPLCLTGIVAFAFFTDKNLLLTIPFFINLIPYVTLLIAAHSLQKNRGIIYYLFVIDGLMIIKAICGIIAAYLN